MKTECVLRDDSDDGRNGKRLLRDLGRAWLPACKLGAGTRLWFWGMCSGAVLRSRKDASVKG